MQRVRLPLPGVEERPRLRRRAVAPAKTLSRPEPFPARAPVSAGRFSTLVTAVTYRCAAGDSACHVRCERGQTTIEWTGLVLVLALALGALAALVLAVHGRLFGGFLTTASPARSRAPATTAMPVSRARTG